MALLLHAYMDDGEGYFGAQRGSGTKMTDPKVLFFEGEPENPSKKWSEEDRKAVEEALRRLESAVETIRIGVTITDRGGKIIYTNPTEASIHGYDREELIGQDARIFAPKEYWNPIKLEKLKEMSTWRREALNIRKDGTVFPVELISETLSAPDGGIIGVVTTCEDITERKEKERILARQAMYDSLTGLANRSLLLDRLEQTYKTKKRTKESFSVIFLDVDHFKKVNDNHGHLAGDETLVKLSERLISCVRPGDTVARFGGDEFVILLDRVKEQKEAVSISQRIQTKLTTPLHLHDREVAVTVSIGIAVQGEEYKDAEEILRKADAAMYRAKARGRNRYQVFDGIMISVPERMQSETAGYRISCYLCTHMYDAIKAIWCKCIAMERSFVCPSCQGCFCKATIEYKEAFWSSAPEILWEKKAEEHKTPTSLKTAPQVWEVRRPLILVVDHNRQILSSVAQLMEDMGYGAVMARDGEEGMKFASRYLPELVFTDGLLPKMDGRQLCRHIKENPATTHIKVILKTGSAASSKFRHEIISQSRADDYLRMPISFSELSAALKKHLS